MTYRAEIQLLISKVWELHGDAGRLRDFADLEEKEAFNKVRGHLSTIADTLGALDNNMPDNRAQMEL